MPTAFAPARIQHPIELVVEFAQPALDGLQAFGDGLVLAIVALALLLHGLLHQGDALLHLSDVHDHAGSHDQRCDQVADLEFALDVPALRALGPSIDASPVGIG